MKKSMKRWNSCLALILTVVTAFLCPLQVAATADETDESVVSQTEEIIEKEPEILYEIESERDAYTKHFKLDDGNIMAVQYNDPVHFLDDEGKWIEYDNSIQSAEPTEATTSDDAFDYENKNSDIDIKLSKKAKANNMFKLISDDYQISWGYDNANKSEIEIINDVTELTDNDKFIFTGNTVQEVLYRNIYNNVDLSCYITSTGIKENLLLNSAETQGEFNVNYKIKGLEAVQNGDNCILLKSNDEVIYTINAPFAQDANGVESDKVTLSILEQKNNKLTIKITLDSNWLSSGEVEFPVTVDPELTVGGVVNTTTSALLSSEQADTAMNQSTYFYVAPTYRGVVKLNQMPELKNSDRIINASILISPMSELSDMTIYSHEVTNAWTEDSVTWNNLECGEQVIDYNTCVSGSTESLEFDITKTAKKWYDGTLSNNGILFESDGTNSAEFGGYQCYYSDKIPVFCVTYKNYNGFDNALSYHTNTIGSNTTTALCDYTGGMYITQTVVNSTGNRMPVSITATYNSFNADKVFLNGSSCGYGWQFSFNQYITETSDLLKENGYDYVFTDGDGTENYFIKKIYEEDESVPEYTEWEDEVGYGTTLWFDDSFAYIDDGSGVIKKYELPEKGGKILSEKDEYNNEIVYSYNNGNLSSIQDGAGRVYLLSYSANSDTEKIRVSQITLPDGSSVCFGYNSAEKDRLSYVEYKDSDNNAYDRTSFVYNQSGIISRIVSFDNSEIRYNSNALGQITKITEYGTDLSVGNYLDISYSNDNTTTFADKYGRSETYTFDNSGNCVAVLNANGYLEGSSSGAMSITSGADSYTHNYVKESNNPNTTYFPSAHGTIGGSQSSGGTVTYDTSTELVDGEQVQYFGKKSVKITNNGESQFYTYVKQTIVGSGLVGKDVTLSSYVKTSGITNMNLADQSGTMLTLKFIGSDGNIISENNSVSVPNDSKWQRISVTANVPTGTENIEVNMALYNAQGSAWFDCMQLEEGSCMNDYNALSNSDFSENGSWDGTPPFNGSPTSEARLSQMLNVNRQNVSFTISGKAQATSVPLRDDRKFGIMLTIVYSDKTTEDHYAEFNYATSQEQVVSLNVVPEKENTIVSAVYYRFVYDYNIGTITPLNSMLNFEYYDSYATTEEEATEETTEIESDTTEETTEEETFDTTPYIGSTSTYDEYGNVTSTANGTIIPSEDGNDTLDASKEHIITHTAYDSTGNYVVSETDQRGNQYSYDVNSLNGRINSVTDAKNNTTSYTYDAAGNVTSVTSGSSSNSYTYSANSLTAIAHNGTSYNFVYNSFGNVVSTRVGNAPLITHTYENNNGKLLTSAYGNGDEISYTYDEFDRITAISSGEEVLARYYYNKKSQPTRIVDYQSGMTTDYEYSQSGSVLGKTKYSSDLSSTYYEYETTDENGDVVKTTIINGVEKTVTESTDENGNYVLKNDGWSLTSQTDDLGRQKTNSTLISEDKKFTTEYTYVNGANDNETTEFIESITHKYGDTVIVKYSYTYDENGNILTVSENDVEKYVYTYDGLNQLSSVVDKQSAIRYLYSYDSAGNIKSVSGQMWDSSSNTAMGSPTTNSYTYGDSSWTDSLTKYKGEEITYDEIGNPIAYRDGMTFSWENGRQLATLTKDDKTTSYTYDVSGIRTQKNVDGTITKYYYDDSNNLVSMTVGDKTLMFYYDQNGSVNSVLYNGVMYYYIKNLQGDIMRIVDGNGNNIAIYAYDQWGKPTAMRKPSSTDVDLVNYNPFLYRGYVYDADSGLYYLQSRYYDPTTGRFLNADVYCDTGTSVLGTNMFAYCVNNAINLVDASGTDAWWLQDTDGVFYMGHTSLLIQERPGRWWYFYWGSDRVKLIYIGVCTLKSLNAFLNNNTNVCAKYELNWKTFRYEWKQYYEPIYDGTYEKRIILKGNFSRSLSYIYYNLMRGTKGISSRVIVANPFYNLTHRNCMQVSIEALSKGIFNNNDFYNHAALGIASRLIIPNAAYNFYLSSQLMINAVYGVSYAWAWMRSYQ